MSYRDGKIIVRNGSNQAVAAWELDVSAAAEAFIVGGPLEFLTSTAEADVLSHDLVSDVLTVEHDAGTTDPGNGADADGAPNDLEQIRGPNDQADHSGTVSSGAATTLTESPSPGWTVDEHATSWVKLRPGLGSEEWRRIVSNTVDTLTVSPAWTSNPTMGDSFIIYPEQTVTLQGFRVGTPQVFTGKVTTNDLFMAENQAQRYGISSIAARALTLAVNWAQSDALGVPFIVATSFSGNRSYARPQPGDANLEAIMSEAIDAIDGDVDTILGGVATALADQNGYTGTLQYAIAGRVVLVWGNTTKGMPSAAEVVATLPVGARPGDSIVALAWGASAAVRVTITTAGEIQNTDGQTSLDLAIAFFQEN